MLNSTRSINTIVKDIELALRFSPEAPNNYALLDIIYDLALEVQQLKLEVEHLKAES